MTTTLDALQTTLAAEHAAVWSLAVLGARTSRSAEPALAAAIDRGYVIHRARRDQLIAAVRDLGVQPVATAVAYDLPGDAAAAPTPARIAATAAEVEDRCLAVYAQLVAGTEGDRRRWAVTALTDSAVHVLGYRESPEIFPGASELADR